MKKLLVYWLPVIVWAIMIFTISSGPVPTVSHIYWREFLLKKIAHILEYLVFYLLIFRALKNSLTVSIKQAYLWALLLLLFYAVTDEFHQTFIFSRTGKILDVFIDLGGGIAAWWILQNLLPITPKKLKSLAKSLQII